MLLKLCENMRSANKYALPEHLLLVIWLEKRAAHSPANKTAQGASRECPCFSCAPLCLRMGVCVCVPQMVCKLCRKCAENKAPTQRYFHGGLLLLIPPRRFHIVGFVLDSLPCSPPLPPAKYAEQNVASMPHAPWQPDKTCRQNLTQLCTRPSPFHPLPATSFWPQPLRHRLFNVQSLARGDSVATFNGRVFLAALQCRLC